MKTIGLLGGMSWESSLVYYRLINEAIKARLGGLHSAKIIIDSANFADIAQWQHQQDWAALTAYLIQRAQSLEKAGADVIGIGTNTMHVLAEHIQSAIGVPLLHIVDVVGQIAHERNLSRLGLLGTQFTMQSDFYRQRLQPYQCQVMVPDESDQTWVHQVIYNELCQGIFNDASKEQLMAVIRRLQGQGADGVILGCTELPLLLSRDQLSETGLIDTTMLHAHALAHYALG